MTKYIIALLELGFKNNNIIWLLQEHSSDIIDMFNDISIFEKYFDLISFYNQFVNRVVVAEALAKADSILIRNKELNIKTTYYTASTYPKELALIADPPVIIYYKGAEFSEISTKAIACVGTRKPTCLSYNAVNYLVPQWVNEGCSIISGLACGVDKISHQACISANGKTIAVLAHGLDIIYPKENFSLAERIIESGGIIMSEYPVGTQTDRFRFVDRNRLIVGMSKVVIVYECDAKGGTMHSVEYARKQHKPIFCPVISKVISEIQTGTKQLLDEHVASEIKEGRDIEGVLDALGCSINKQRMSNKEIKYNYLHSIITILDSPLVLKASLKDMNINITATDNIYDMFIELINEKNLNIDNLIQSLVKNNIASIEKRLM